MAYRRSVQKQDKQDIRHLSLTSEIKKDQTSNHQEAVTTLHNPKAEFIRIAWCSLPLIVALAVGSYIDTTRPWVINLAQSFLSLGS